MRGEYFIRIEKNSDTFTGWAETKSKAVLKVKKFLKYNKTASVEIEEFKTGKVVWSKFQS